MTQRQPTRNRHLRTLTRLRAKRERALFDLDREQYAAVLDARLEGATWAAIGQALGVSPQAAQKRYAPSSPTP